MSSAPRKCSLPENRLLEMPKRIFDRFAKTRPVARLTIRQRARVLRLHPEVSLEKCNGPIVHRLRLFRLEQRAHCRPPEDAGYS
jgi:hypothetical protein